MKPSTIPRAWTLRARAASSPARWAKAKSQSVDLGFGEGEEGGDVPVGEYAGEYAQAAARAAEAENLPDSLKTYVDEYFSSLTGGDRREP